MCNAFDFYLDVFCSFILSTYELFAFGCSPPKDGKSHRKKKVRKIKVKILLTRVGLGYLINICGFLAICFTNRDTENEGDITFFLFCGITIYTVLFYALVTFMLVYRIYMNHMIFDEPLRESGSKQFMMIYRCLEIFFDIAVLLYSFLLSDWEMTEFTIATTALSCSDIGINLLMLMANCLIRNESEEDGDDKESENKDPVVKQNELVSGKLSIEVEVGDITKKKVDVIVATVASDFDLSKGMLSKAILNAAGPDLQNQCQIQNRLKPGEIKVVKGCALQCKEIYFGFVPEYKDESSQKELQLFVMKCLETADAHQQITIAFPTVGTGTLGFPVDTMADILISGCVEFGNMTKGKKHIHIVVYDKENTMGDNAEQSLIKKMNILRGPGLLNTKKKYTKIREERVEHVKKNAFKEDINDTNFVIGDFSVNVSVGDLTQFEGTVIVSTSPKNMILSGQNMSNAVLSAAGGDLQSFCSNEWPKGIKSNNLAITEGFKLKCKFIYFGCIPDWSQRNAKQILKDFITNCLKEANSHPLTRSIAFPTLGIGFLRFPPNAVADIFVSCFHAFSNNNVEKSLKKIHIIVYEKSPSFTSEIEAIKTALGKGV